MSKLYARYKYFVIITSAISILWCIVAQCINGYEILFLMPFVYLLLFLVSNKLHKYSSHNIGLFMLNVLMFIKYSITPLIIAIYQDFSVHGYYNIDVSQDSNRLAIVVLLIEMIAVFLTIFVFSDKFYKKEFIVNNQIEKIPVTPFLAVIVLSLVTAVALNLDIAIPKNILLINEAFDGNSFENTGMVVVVSLSKLLLSGLLINHFILNYKKTNKTIYVLLSYMTVLILCLLNTSTSRRSMILPLALFVIITHSIFKGKGRLMLLGSVVLILTSLVSVTIYKSSWLYNENNNDYYSVATTSLGGIQEYVSSVRPTAIGIEMLDTYGGQITPTTFFNDFLGSVPYISGMINQNNRLNKYYNYYIFNNDNTSQIVPMSTVGLAYFGVFFSWVPISFCVFLLMFFEKLFGQKSSTNYMERYLNLYLFFVLAASLNSNTQMICARIICNFLPAYIIMKINGALCIKRTKK